MPLAGTQSNPPALNGLEQRRNAVLLLFCEPPPARCVQLASISAREWKQLLSWLDTSGLALYFLQRITDLQLQCWLPDTVLERLGRNLSDNTARTQDLMQETAEICRRLLQHQVPFALLKGFSLFPESVPRPELRSQLDLDLLIEAPDAILARRILEDRGYALKVISGRTWEFITPGDHRNSINDLYKISSARAVEVHVLAGPINSAVRRTPTKPLMGMHVPVLSDADIFIGQAVHAFKHIRSEFSRTAHLLEFYRHIVYRRNDRPFWHEVRIAAEPSRETTVAIGTIVMLITNMMGSFAPEELTCWTVDVLPPSLHLWAQIYGPHAVLAGFPGSKLYLLLERELQSLGVTPKRTFSRSLIPRRLPPAMQLPATGETYEARFRRSRKQFSFIVFRLRFHISSGLQLLVQSFLFSRRVRRLA